MGCSVKGNGKSGELIQDGTPTGLQLNHAYSLMHIWEVKGKPSIDAKGNTIEDIQRIVVLRNPWGHGEWKLAFSDDSPEYLKYQDSIDLRISELDDEEQFGRLKKNQNQNDRLHQL